MVPDCDCDETRVLDALEVWIRWKKRRSESANLGIFQPRVWRHRVASPSGWFFLASLFFGLSPVECRITHVDRRQPRQPRSFPPQEAAQKLLTKPGLAHCSLAGPPPASAPGPIFLAVASTLLHSQIFSAIRIPRCTSQGWLIYSIGLRLSGRGCLH